MLWSWIFDGVLILLLGATLWYCWQLNRRLAVLHESKEELAHLLGEFSHVAGWAESTLATLRETGETNARLLDERLSDGKALADELFFITDKADKLSRKLDVQLGAGRGAVQQEVQDTAPPPAVPAKSAGTSGNDPSATIASIVEKISKRNKNAAKTSPAPAPVVSQAEDALIQALDKEA